MGKIICVANQKGGVGKTTTVINLGASLATRGKKTLLIDLDPQANTTSGVGLDKSGVDKGIYFALIGEVEFKETIVEICPEELKHNLSACPSNADLTGASVELTNASNREWRLRNALRPVAPEYDFVIIDCPPSLGILTVNAFGAADSVLIPIQCEYYAMEGLSDLQNTFELIRDYVNPALEIEGYLLTMFDPRNRLAHVVAGEVRGYFNNIVFDTIIPRNVRLAESPSYGIPVIMYDRHSSGATSYLSLAEEIITRNGGEGGKGGERT